MTSRQSIPFQNPSLFVVVVAGFLWFASNFTGQGAEAGFTSQPLALPPPHANGFTLLSPGMTNIRFTNSLSEQAAAQNQIRLNGSGVALGDVDGDGWCDIYVCALEKGNRLYRNLGNWKFQDSTEQAQVGCGEQFSTGCVFADLDADRDLDLLVNGIGKGTRCFLNQGTGQFSEATDAGFLRSLGAMSMAVGDVDRDGDLDVYVANYRTTTIRSTGLSILNVNGKRRVRPEDRDQLEITPEGRVLEHGEPDVLYLNDGKGRFAAQSWTNGTFLDEQGLPLRTIPRDWGLSVMFRDINQDGWPDIYVCNDFHSPDRVWLNIGKGKFRAINPTALRHTSTFSMSVDFADINRDGFDDFFVADMLDRKHPRRTMQIAAMEPNDITTMEIAGRPQYNRNTLQLNRGDGTFAEIAYYAGIEASGWTWSTIFLDVDLDGFEDLLATTGHMFDTQDLDADRRIQKMGPFNRDNVHQKLLHYPRWKLAKVAFRNTGQLAFEEKKDWGFNDEGVAHGMALADLDKDGDLDVVVNELNGPLGIYRNNSVAPRLAVRLSGESPNLRGIGARIKVLGGPVPQTQEMICGGRYLSGDDAERVFACGPSTNLSVEVIWPTGKRSIISNALPDHLYNIFERSAPPYQHESESIKPMFEDMSALLGHRHKPAAQDDFAVQPLLPYRLSQLGPGLAWGDLNGDEIEDLIIGSGAPSETTIFYNRGKGIFESTNVAPIIPASQTGIVIGVAEKKGTQIVTGLLRLRIGESNAAGMFISAIGATPIALPNKGPSTGPLALADMDGDGDLDLFIGGRFIPGRYPEPASSHLYRNDSGHLVIDPSNELTFREIGLVSGAVFSDLDGDGYPELILACEWGPLRVFQNVKGKFSDASSSWGTKDYQGLWMGVATGDVNGDGKPDLIASNWGLNTSYRASSANPQRLYFGDLEGKGSLDLIEAHFDRDLKKWVPERDLNSLARALPFVAGNFKSYASFGTASVNEICPDKCPSLQFVEVNFLSSAVFLNRNGKFEVAPLPPEAQFAPAFGVNVADMDGDGNEDIFLAQNFFAAEPYKSRSDAGRGLWLRGDGSGKFSAIPAQQSGIKIYGEQRGSAVADYDEDGRVDLAVAQTGAQTRLYKNVGAKPGLLIRLAGPGGNPTGVGAAIRLISGEVFGPTREVQAGSGYWSQNGAVQVMANPSLITGIRVRWPGGKETVSKIPGLAKKIKVHLDGTVETVN